MITKRYNYDQTEKKCKNDFHGRFTLDDNRCEFYLKAQKICLVIDQESEELGLLENYQSFPCDTKKEIGDHVKWQAFKWSEHTVEP